MSAAKDSTVHASTDSFHAALTHRVKSAAVFQDTALFSQKTDSSLRLFPDTTAAPQLMLQPLIAKTETTVVFGRHELHALHRGPISRPELTPGWLFPVLLLIVSVFTWLRLFYTRYFNQMLSAVFNTNLTNQLVRDENILVQRATVYLSLLFYLIASLFLYELSFRLSWDLSFAGNGFPRFLFFTIVVSSVYAIKFLVLKFCGWLFDLDREFSTYLFNVFITNNALGMILFPFIVIMAYNRSINPAWLFSACLIITAVAFLYRLIRGVLIGLGTAGVRLHYLFLYLCALELAPLLVLVRLSSPN